MKYDGKKVRSYAELIATANKLPVSLVDKDIWITYMLREIRLLPESTRLAFKGGTCLVKAYFGYYRFSEDIDFTWTGGKIKERDFRTSVIKPVMETLGLGWYTDEKVEKGMKGTQSGRVMNYFLISPEANGQASKLKTTVAFEEKLEFPLQEMKLNHLPVDERKQEEAKALYGDAASDYFDATNALCYSIKEIACEKIRAILTRKPQLVRSRDIVDLYKISEHQGRLEKAAPPKAVKAKLDFALRIPAYKTEYARTTANLHEHLHQLALQATQDPVYIEEVRIEDLTQFIATLEGYLKTNCITPNPNDGLQKASAR